MLKKIKAIPKLVVCVSHASDTLCRSWRAILSVYLHGMKHGLTRDTRNNNKKKHQWRENTRIFHQINTKQRHQEERSWQLPFGTITVCFLCISCNYRELLLHTLRVTTGHSSQMAGLRREGVITKHDNAWLHSANRDCDWLWRHGGEATDLFPSLLCVLT